MTGTYPHSADISVVNFLGPGDNLRIDVKTGAEYGACNLRANGVAARAWTNSRESSTTLQHAPVYVLPFVVSSAGQLGYRAESFIKEVHTLAGGQIGGDVTPTHTVPSCTKYWHRRLRVYALTGAFNMLCVVLGLAPNSPDHAAYSFSIDAERNRLALLANGLWEDRMDFSPPPSSGTLPQDPTLSPSSLADLADDMLVDFDLRALYHNVVGA